MSVHGLLGCDVKFSDWPWKPNPDYNRLLKALRRQGDPGYVPFLELFADPEVIAAVLGEPVIPQGAETAEKGHDQRIRFSRS